MIYLNNTSENTFSKNTPQVIRYFDNTSGTSKVQYCPYVHGLVFWLDGIYKGNTNNAWIDLINGVTFTNYSSTTPVVRNDNHFYFPSGSSMTSSAALDFNYTTHTLEIVYEKPLPQVGDPTAGTMFVPKTSNAIAFGFVNGSMIAVKTRGGVMTINGYNILTGAHTVSFIYNSTIMHNGTNDVTWNPSNQTNSWTVDSSGNSVLGMRPGQANYQFMGKIYSIRIYNRLLSADEMNYNQIIDNARFKLNIDKLNINSPHPTILRSTIVHGSNMYEPEPKYNAITRTYIIEFDYYDDDLSGNWIITCITNSGYSDITKIFTMGNPQYGETTIINYYIDTYNMNIKLIAHRSSY